MIAHVVINLLKPVVNVSRKFYLSMISTVKHLLVSLKPSVPHLVLGIFQSTPRKVSACIDKSPSLLELPHTPEVSHQGIGGDPQMPNALWSHDLSNHEMKDVHTNCHENKNLQTAQAVLTPESGAPLLEKPEARSRLVGSMQIGKKKQ